MEKNGRQQKQNTASTYGYPYNARAAAGLVKLIARFGAKTGTTIFLSPLGWVAIGIGIVVVGTFLIVFSAGTPFPSTSQPTPNPSPTPSFTPTPTIQPTATKSP